MSRNELGRLGRANWGLLALALLVSSLAVSGCSKSAIPIEAPDELYKQAVRDHADEDYDFAVENYRELLDHYPLDPRAEEIELRVAHAHMANDSHPEAIAAFSDFQRMHPTSRHLPEVEYRIGESYVAQMDSVDRDLNAAKNAHQRLQGVLARYPGGEFSQQARETLDFVREHLAGRQLYIADFYFERDSYEAGWARTAVVMNRFPETTTAAEAAQRLSEEAESRGDDQTAQLAGKAAVELEESRPEKLAPNLRYNVGPALLALRAHLKNGPPQDPSAEM